ncbi:MAG: SagB/ThcOx family dehydrogenase [Deltaproteobacteria bacterium]|nr:SagB/ThcOx family dehydrogenase [Deltaproteobacteria bacterium]
MKDDSVRPRPLRQARIGRATAALATLALAFAALIGSPGCRAADVAPPSGDVPLPAARTAGSVSLEAAMAGRKPVHGFGAGEVSAAEVAQLLWAAQGIIAPGARTAPSPGGLHALEVYVARADGVHRYVPASNTAHSLVKVVPLDVRKAIALATGDADELRAAPVLVVITAQPARARQRFGDKAERMVAIEGGHAGQNVLLQATAMGLAATPLGVFDDEALRKALVLPSDHLPIHVIAVGRPLQ